MLEMLLLLGKTAKFHWRTSWARIPDGGGGGEGGKRLEKVPAGLLR